MTKKHDPALASTSIVKPIVVIGAILGVVLIVALGAMYYIAGTPAYSLYKLRAAVREADFVTFDEYFDTPKVISSAIQREVGWLPAGPLIVSQRATELLIPASEKLISQRIQERLADKNSSPMLGMTYESVSYVNNAAIVTLKDPTDGSETKLTLERQPNRRWKVTDLDLGKAGISYSLADARAQAEQLLKMQPSMPEAARPGLEIPGVPAMPIP